MKKKVLPSPRRFFLHRARSPLPVFLACFFPCAGRRPASAHILPLVHLAHLQKEASLFSSDSSLGLGGWSLGQSDSSKTLFSKSAF